MDRALSQALRGAHELHFVCSGNMIRSAFCELLARHRGIGCAVSSSATTYRNPAIHPRAAEALLERGLPPEPVLAFQPRHVADLEGGLPARGVVLVMTEEHRRALAALGCGAPTFLLRAAQGREEDIADPLFEGGWSRTFATLEACVEELVRFVGTGGRGHG